MSKQNHDAAAEWTRTALDKALADLTDLGVIQDVLVESRVAWSIPGKVMIGQARHAAEPGVSVWFISGDLPTDYIGGSAATTPREALRYFSMKWQIDAERYNDPETRKAHGLDEGRDWSSMTAKLVAKAEELYAMSADDRLWQRAAES